MRHCLPSGSELHSARLDFAVQVLRTAEAGATVQIAPVMLEVLDKDLVTCAHPQTQHTCQYAIGGKEIQDE